MPIKYKHNGKGNLRKIAKELPKVVGTATREYCRELVKEAKRILAEAGVSTTGNLARSFKIERVAVNQYASKWVVGNTAPYAVFVEYGRRPGSENPPFDNILDWVLEKGLTPYNPEVVRSPEGLAYLVMLSIAEDGIEPVFFMSRAFGDADLRRTLKKGFSLAFREAAAKYRARRGN